VDGTLCLPDINSLLPNKETQQIHLTKQEITDMLRTEQY